MTATQLRRSVDDLDPAAPAEDPGSGVRGLRAVPGLEPAPRRTPFAVFLALLLGGGLAGLLLLNTQLQQGSFTLSALQTTDYGLSDTAQILAQQADALGAPQALQSAAAGLGMVPAAGSQFLDLAKQSVQTAQPVTPVPRPATPAEVARARAKAARVKALKAEEAKAKAAAAKAAAAKAAAAKAAAAKAAAEARATALPSPVPTAASRPTPDTVPTPAPKVTP